MARHAALTDTAFIARHGAWRGPTKKARCSSTSTNTSRTRRRIWPRAGRQLRLAGARPEEAHTLVEKNIAALGELLQLNPAERALLLYGTLARYQRELRGLLVEFKVSNAQQAFAAIAAVAGVDEREVAEALRAGSRLERIGMVENLISEHNITDLADLMKVSDQLPPVLMREYRGPDELMAVFTRPAARSTLTAADFHFVADDVGLLTGCCATRWLQARPASTCCCTARPAPARPNWPRSARRRPDWSSTRSSTPTATATR